MTDPATLELLSRWRGGDRDALARLVQRDLPWIREFVRRRLGGLLRARGETEDYVQEAMIEVLRDGPRFVLSDLGQFRALVGRIVENTLRDRHEFLTAKKRAAAREAALPTGSVINLDPGVSSVTRPSEAADTQERQAWVRLALEMLDPEDRKVILLREWHGLEFAEVGARMGLQENTARMRFTRALPRLAEKVRDLRAGKLAAILNEVSGEMESPGPSAPARGS